DNQKGMFELTNKKTSLRLEVKGNEPFVMSLDTQNHRQTVGEPVGMGMPKEYQSGSETVAFKWEYKGYEYEKGNRGAEGIVLRFEDGGAGFAYCLHVLTCPDYSGPFEFYGELTNNGNGPKTVLPGAFFNASIAGEGTPVLTSFKKESGVAEGWQIHDGTFFKGSGIYTQDLTERPSFSAYTSPNQDWNAGGYIPMFYVDYGSYGYYMGMEWSDCTLAARYDRDQEQIQVSAQLYKFLFKTSVPSGTTMLIPSIYLGTYDGDIDDGSNQFKRWYLNCKSPELIMDNPDEPLTQQDDQIGVTASSYGIQSVKWDYGWWDSEPANGNWRTNEGLLERTGSSIREYADKVNAAGMKLALYILLKDTGLDREGVPTSVGEYGHPEWFSRRIVTVGKSADLGNEECVKFFQQYLSNFLKENHVTTWRSDFEPICRESDKENRHASNGNDVGYWCTVGFSELVDYLYENVPGFRYESCSSGGSMKDLFTMTKAVVINCDDSADYMSLHMSFYDSSFCIHPAQLQLPCNPCTFMEGYKYYTGTADIKYGMRATMTGGVMYGFWDTTNMMDVVNGYWPEMMGETYNKKIKPLIREGDLYHILPRPDGVHWDGLEYVDADTDREIKGLVMLWKPTDEEGSVKHIVLRGLHEDVQYRLVFEDRPEQNAVYSGKTLMETGLDVTIEEAMGSEYIWIYEAE
ncbi:MAG: GH36 C-terminal domain-containing protein, partial [Clostridia bacterium]|nr:GH36 C-terminal domain-containing protein [Clostridia bacterium]